MHDLPTVICHEITTEAGFVSLKASWNTLFAQCAYPSPFCSWDWAWEWWQHFGAADSLCFRLLIVAAYDSDNHLIGLAPFYYPSEAPMALRLRPLRPLGTRIRCTLDDLTEEPLLLLRQGQETAALSAILSHLLHRSGPWDLIHVRLMRRPGDPDLPSLWQAAAQGTSFRLNRSKRRYVQTVSLPETWAEFRCGLSKSMRDNLTYYPRLLTREGHQWQVRVARDPMEVGPAVQTLVHLHHRRALSARGPVHTDHFPTRRQQEFLEHALVRLAESGHAAVLLLEANGQTIAAQAVLEHAGVLTFYYSGFDPAWHRYSPLLILNAEAIQSAIARGFTTVNYLPEPEPWKTRWGAESTFVLEDVSGLSLHPRAITRSAWRSLIRSTSSSCECGYCLV